eukprot:g42572.t1
MLIFTPYSIIFGAAARFRQGNGCLWRTDQQMKCGGAISTFSWCLVHQLLHCAKDSKAATATNCFERSIEASMDLVATLVKQLQIGQEEIRKCQEEDRKRQEEDRSVKKRTGSVKKRTGSVKKRTGSVKKRTGSVKKRTGASRRGQEASRRGPKATSDCCGRGGRIEGGMLGEIRQRHSIHGSWVGTNTKEGKAITTFISNQVLGLIDYTWKVNLDEFASVDQEVKNFADFTQHSDLYAALNVENDNQYNIKVNIQDSKKNVVHLTTRPDFLILPKAYATKNQRLDQVYLQTILFVEVISGQKTEDESLRQLLTTLRAVAAHTAKHARLYGIVVDKHFTQARLVKYQFYACFSDGTFHPSRLHGVCEMLLRF